MEVGWRSSGRRVVRPARSGPEDEWEEGRLAPPARAGPGEVEWMWGWGFEIVEWRGRAHPRKEGRRPGGSCLVFKHVLRWSVVGEVG